MAISKIILNGVTQMDLTGDTVEANNLLQNYTAHKNDGTQVTGTATQGITPTGTLNITANNTYDVTNYASAVVNVSGGSSAWTKVAETSYQVSTTSTTTGTVATFETGHSELWTSSKWVYVRIRDTAGKRNGYFYGSDQFFYNTTVANGSTTSESVSNVLRIVIRYSDNAFAHSASTSTSSQGVFADLLTSSGEIRIRRRYNATYSLTINGTYKVEVYLLNTPDGMPIFN